MRACSGPLLQIMQHQTEPATKDAHESTTRNPNQRFDPPPAREPRHRGCEHMTMFQDDNKLQELPSSAPVPLGDREPEATPGQPVLALGQWYWVLPEAKTAHGEEGDEDTVGNAPVLAEFEPDDPVGEGAVQPPHPDAWLGCLTHIGSNHVLIEHPEDDRCRSTIRVHFDEFWQRLQREPDPTQVIAAYGAHYQRRSARLLQKIQDLTLRLGLSQQTAIAAPGARPATQPPAAGGALAVLNSTADVHAYRSALQQAREETLPALLKELETSNNEVVRWMRAQTLPMMAMAGQMKGAVVEVEQRIFHVSLYAGLTEESVQCRDGKPAAIDEKLHIMQRRLYMDEECLLQYQAGGLEFSHIEEFDRWMARTENMTRILPFERCMVAMRVRRDAKERVSDGSIPSLLINIQLQDQDKLTFLYVRNGEQLWRLSTDLEFDELIFPDRGTLNLAEPMMFKTFASRIDRFMTVAEYEQACAEHKAAERSHEQWLREHPSSREWDSPFHARMRFGFEPWEWRRLDPGDVYYDDAMAEIQRRVMYYNRIALIVQGLYDRSMALHPHLPARTWDAHGFEQAIELVYDASYALYYGEPPDFEQFRARCNATASADCHFVGQEDAWMRREADRENRRRENNWRTRRTDYRPSRLRPHGDPGPGLVAKPSRVQLRARTATFEWERHRRTYSTYGDNGLLKCSIALPFDELLNVDAYQPGDFRQFYRDPRTRAQYLKWAPLLLAAEDWHARQGDRKQGETG